MRYNIEYTYDATLQWSSGVEKHISGEYNLVIGEELQDVVEYMFEKEYNKVYNPLSWYLEEGAKEMVKEVESLWWNNALDTYPLYHDYDFLEFLKKKYSTQASIGVEREVLRQLQTSFDKLSMDVVNYTITTKNDYFYIENSYTI